MIIGPPRHLGLLPASGAERIDWPVPFAEGMPILLGLRGRRAVALVSGDPFWFGAGRVIAEALEPGEWRALPGPSTFSLVASRLGWGLERCTCLGLHAAPLTRLRPHLAPGQRLIVLLRDGSALVELARYLTGLGFGASLCHVFEALGGPREARTSRPAEALLTEVDFAHPVCAALELSEGAALPLTPGLPDAAFETDGQITKSPIRALTLAALAPRAGERLWDIGGGSGSVAIEWLRAHPACDAVSFEPRPDRAARIRANALAHGVDRLRVIEGRAPEALKAVPPPDAVFIGGGLSQDLLEVLRLTLSPGTRLVTNAVTLESEALLAAWQETLGGELLRIEVARAAPLGRKRGWKSAYPVVQWSVVL
ncbi:precorrin-6Y C5,15-methyltransferase (decarboxylating) [Poseidonocella sedimentorum]|uniref:Precorrin-6Y C5,15-methyltransferase (Decarboxylating) n=1 Tax=Poseidonocella sedimentorum TaxID=871652 RepID=A0A1I6EKM7_9RHOB|nr:precorrin-6Y C5,15-methyltransferase (decarboxylating) [Poseidonocella sedimentorum]